MTPMQIQMQTIPLAVSHAGSSRDAEGAALVRGWPQGLGPMSMGFHGSWAGLPANKTTIDRVGSRISRPAAS